MDGLNCDPMSFDKECSLINAKFPKNKKSSEIKSHHYIISFDPDDRSECGLTGEKAQELCLNLAQKIFPGYQALIVTHTDGHNGSGNIHTHIVINSVRKEAVRRQSYMDKPHEEIAGYKHRSTNKFLNYFKKEIMDMCIQEGLHQIDLLSPAETKITQAEYMAQKSGQDKERLEKLQKRIQHEQIKYEPARNVSKTYNEIDRMGQKTITGKMAISKEDYSELTALLLHLLHTLQILYPAKRPAYAPGIFPHQTHSFYPHPPIPYISYAL